ncbi:DUF4112 domain-containing protein [Desulfobacter hydrogenophilus]|uniref:DUF4112 domain-containing protein n=1 Tax=Desulfobacter hydrogenophilus TaxID=2291 RepID=A0A328FHE5_9BACT|nr:DUF4112 domain-containing protein [Desulfobacter hydrogenophilus]NDY70612.1 DUF4112 domain-containing protein [Desulfobacter hydrogenophilus]QBH13981.1 DUF4112 domain-containing protein [Desulfobacter hydrogenophilus]RAM03606.1 DUF4112 domain-containing protein [Desulfobacter hydrogenophilus]
MQKTDKEKSRKKLERLAHYLDSLIKVPGFNARFGLDGLIGLIPGFGDTIGALISSVVISEAARLGAPKVLLLKMALNIALDALAGTVPVLGDLFDFVWKANQRNVHLLDSYLANPRETVVTSRLFVWGLGAVLIGLVIFVGMLGFFLVRAFLNVFVGVV